ncbi:hypothetical protein RFI_20312 [Reticulomyxa filosa]|uniref:Uncharacterized protein n=1 Tax=Reticulomyxa filosa TaxID=46433 RepID=X6MTP4_RETFI|nr:hypothetical protein RFI_20312 [Reticulomyxa filosa]|eukprot:ETO17026.1 hypothetical protein RFI_20312 [Reticulomyxa filosa]
MRSPTINKEFQIEQDIKTSEKEISQEPSSSVAMEAVIKDKRGFNLFMQHLHFEFSMVKFSYTYTFTCFVFLLDEKCKCYENLLSLTEMVQFQQYYSFDRIRIASTLSLSSPSRIIRVGFPPQETPDIEEEQKTDAFTPLQELITLPPDIPQSSIVYNTKYTMIEKLRLLSDKYVITGSELELNISSRLRNKIVSFLRATDEQFQNDDSLRQQALFLFDPVVEEIIGVMMDSFWRFLFVLFCF